MNKMISDYELIQRFIKGEQSCFEQLIHRHKNKVFAYISLYIRDQALAEDLFQDTFMKVIQSVKAGKYYDNGKFLSWVMRMNQISSIQRSFLKERLKTILLKGRYRRM
jgi:RNA polymerase sigma factor (sigma-70 family)